MASDERELGKTDLIDVGEIPTDFDDEFTMDRGGRAASASGEEADSQAPTIAELKDRFAAFFIDCSLLYALYWPLMVAYRAVVMGAAAGPVPAAGVPGLIFHGIFLLIALLWFTLSEFSLGASPGKLLCHLYVRGQDGGHVSFGSALVRNLLRPIDMLLAPILVPVACMEWTDWHKRLGDMAAHTLVIRTLNRPPRRFALSLDLISSVSRRAVALVIDLAILCGWALGYALLLSPRMPVGSMLLTVMAPLFLLAYFVLPEWLLHTSPGKWIMGLSVCHEDGSASSLATALVRNIWKPFDLNPLGFLTGLMNVRRQRPGDAAAGSLVVKASREWRGAISICAALLLAAVLLYAGANNRQNLLSGDFEVNFLPDFDVRGRASTVEEMREANLGIRDFQFAAGDPLSIRKPSIFQPGETLFMVFDVGGVSVKNGEVWIQEDVDIRYPDGTVGLKLENINDFRQKMTKRGLIRFENNIALPERSLPGRYTVTITLRDKHARREIKEQRFFYITPPEEAPLIQPPTPPPAPEAPKAQAQQDEGPSAMPGPAMSEPVTPPAAPEQESDDDERDEDESLGD